MKKEEIYEDYLAIFGMKAPISRRVRMLSELMGCYEDHWRVVGITEEALKRFKEYDFKKTSKMGINRSHESDRNVTYKHMLSEKMEIESWWSYYIERDITILSTSSENMSKDKSIIIKIDTERKLFKSQGFAWRHGKEETLFLKSLYNDLLSDTKANENITKIVRSHGADKFSLAKPVNPRLEIKNVWLFNISNALERDNKQPFDATVGDWMISNHHCQIKENEPQYAIGLSHGISRVVIQISKWMDTSNKKKRMAGDNINESEIGIQLLEKDFSRITGGVGFWQRGRPIRVDLNRDEFLITYGVKDGRSGQYLA